MFRSWDRQTNTKFNYFLLKLSKMGVEVGMNQKTKAQQSTKHMKNKRTPLPLFK